MCHIRCSGSPENRADSGDWSSRLSFLRDIPGEVAPRDSCDFRHETPYARDQPARRADGPGEDGMEYEAHVFVVAVLHPSEEMERHSLPELGLQSVPLSS